MRVYPLVFACHVVLVNALNVVLSHKHDVPVLLSLLVLIGSFSTAGFLAEWATRRQEHRPKRRSRRARRCRRQYHLAKIPGRN